MIKVSIITATYNASKTLGQCMDSVLNQSYSDIEYIIIDGASTDDSVSLIKNKVVDNPQIKWSSKPDKGIYDALNKGIALATGKVVGFLHADDVLANKRVIEEIMTTFSKHDCDGVYGNLNYVAANNTKKIIRKWTSQAYRPKLIQRGWMPAHPTLYLKTEVYSNYGLFNTSYKIAADYDFILRIFKQQDLKFVYLPETIVKMRVGGASNRDLKHILRKMKEDLRALKQNNVGGLSVLIKKNLSKLPQFFKKS